MLNKDVQQSMPRLDREVPVPPERFDQLRRAISCTELVKRTAAELILNLITESNIIAEEAWDECAHIAGFASTIDAHRKGFSLTLNGRGVIQVRSQPHLDEGLADNSERE